MPLCAWVAVPTVTTVTPLTTETRCGPAAGGMLVFAAPVSNLPDAYNHTTTATSPSNRIAAMASLALCREFKLLFSIIREWLGYRSPIAGAASHLPGDRSLVAP